MEARAWLGALVFLAATPALATVSQGNGELGLDFGATEFDPDTTGHTGVRVALRGGYHFSRFFELEGLIGTSIYFESSQFEFPNVKDLHRVFDLTYSFVNGVFNFRPHNDRIVPYVYAGIGSATLNLSRSFEDRSTATALGAGCRFFGGEDEQVAFRIDLSVMAADNFNVDATHKSLTLGFTHRLGARR